jgi:glycosyltransferase involved in cell wall biosynthesis
MISLCAIAKNEAHCVGAMLESVRPLVSEIIIVDTGSTDDTCSVAHAHGATVHHHTWKNDFAEARNFSLSLAKNPWILVLDCDEELIADSIPKIKELLQGPPQAYFIDRHHFFATPNPATFSTLSPDHPAALRGAQAYFATHDIRLFPNVPTIRFAGAVHESPEDSLLKGGYTPTRTDCVIYHFGHLFGGERAREKAGLYLELAHHKVANDPQDWRAWYHLGVELQNHHRHVEAMHAFGRGITLCQDFAPLWRQIGISLCAHGEYTTAFEAFTEALSKDHACPLTWNALGVAFIQVKSFDAARLCFETILAGDGKNPAATTNLQIVEQLQELHGRS